MENRSEQVHPGPGPHPELQQGERWVTNIEPRSVKNLTLPGKRVGKVAYGINGKVIDGLIPVFAKVE